jgi:hypothetical protein
MQGAQKQRPTMKKVATPKCKGLGTKHLRWKKEATPKRKGLKTKDLRWKVRQPQNVRGSKPKIFDEERGNPREASFTHLALEAEGDAFYFHQTQVFNGESHEGGPINQK